MTTLYSKIEQDMDCPKEIVIWNYFDHEHVVGTHYKHYENIRVIAEHDRWAFCERDFKIPLVPFRVTSRNISALVSPDRMLSYHLASFGVMHEQTYTFTDLGPERCRVTLESRMRLPAAFGVLKPLLDKWYQAMCRKWFYATWDEDVPMRARRWKVWKLGFRNFVGIDYVNEKTEKPAGRGDEPRPYPIEMPVPKATSVGEEGYRRLFDESVEVGYGT
jgi:hypothetical protein